MERKIKVMQITDNLGIGGLERVVANLCKYIDKSKYDISVCCLSFKGKFGEELERIGMNVHLIPQKKGTDYFAFWKLKDILGRIKPDITHTHNSNALVDGAIASIIKGVPIRIHTDHARQFPDTKRTMFAERLIALFLDRIVAVSVETKGNLVKYELIPEKMITVINNGIEGSRYDIKIDEEAKKRELGLDAFRYLIGLGVRLKSQKGIIHLIKAVPNVLKTFPEIAFVVAGEGPLRASLEEECKKMGVDKNFFFLGPRLDLPEILQILDLYVLPSEWEGLPLVILEAMAAGRAIIATDVGGNSVAIEDGKTGYLVPPKNPDALADKIVHLLSSPEKRQKFAEAARNKFYAEFSVERMVSKYENIYEEALSKKKVNG